MYCTAVSTMSTLISYLVTYFVLTSHRYMPEAVVFNKSTIDNYNQSSYYYWRWYDR